MNSRNIFLILFLVVSVIYGQLDRSKIPAPGAAPSVAFPDYEVIKMNNGLKVILVKNDELPTIAFSLTVDKKPSLEKEFAGVGDITGQMLRTGTNKRTKDQLDNEIDLLGASVNSFGNGVFASGLSKHKEKLLELLSDIALNPSFNSDELDKIKEQTISGIKYRKSDPNALVNSLGSKVLFGNNHPYGEIQTEETVGKITREKCREVYQEFFKPNLAILTVVGNFDKKEILPLINKYFGNWKKSKFTENKFKDPEMPNQREIALIDRDNSVQSVINVLQVVKLKKGAKDVVPASVMNTILGGGIFRLFTNLREKHAFTYGAYSSLNSDELIGQFSAQTSVRNIVTDSALTEIFYEINRIRNEKVEDKELAMAKNYMSGSFVLSLESSQTIARYATEIERYNLPKDYYKTYLKKVEAVKSTDVMSMAQKYLQPDRMIIALVGKGKEISEKISKFGRITLYDEDFNKIENKKSDAINITADEIFEKYIEKTGGKDKYNSLKDRTVFLSGKMQGMEVNVKIINKSPDKMYTETSFGTMFKMEIGYNGKSGWIKGMQGLQDLDGDELDEFKKSSMINFYSDYKKAGINASITGEKNIKGKPTYEVSFSKDGKIFSKEYFSKDDFLKYREIRIQKGPQGEVEQVTDLSDYKEFNGFMVPVSQSQSAMGQSIDLKLEKFDVNTGIDDKIFEKP